MTAKFYNSGLDYAKKLIGGFSNPTITNEYDLVHEAIINYTGSCEKEFFAQIKKEFRKSINTPQFFSLDKPRTSSGLSFSTLLHEDFKFKNYKINADEIACSRCKESKPSACYRIRHIKKRFTYFVSSMCHDCEKEYHRENGLRRRTSLDNIYIKTLIRASKTGRLINIDEDSIRKYRESVLKKRARKRQRNSKRYISKTGYDFLCNTCEKVILTSQRYRDENRCCACAKKVRVSVSSSPEFKIKKKERCAIYYKRNREILLRKKRERYINKPRRPKKPRDTKWYKKLSPEKYEKYLRRKRDRMKELRKNEDFKKKEYERLKVRRSNPVFKQKERERQLWRYYNVEKNDATKMNSRRMAQKKYKLKVRMRSAA